jgi:hypothetical protein
MLKSNDTPDFKPVEKIHLRKLEALLNHRSYLFPCVRDLLENGVTGTAYVDDNYRPSRQDITHHLAKWSNSIGILFPDCLEWLTEYSLDILSPVSSSSSAQIRHSTKSVVKYVYNSDVAFDCKKEKNVIRARCERDCPVYNISFDSHVSEPENAIDSFCDKGQEVADFGEKMGQVKNLFREQFDQAMIFAREQLASSLSIKRIVRLLNDKGFKTRTGKEWTISTLGNELRRSGGAQDENLWE